MASDQPRHPLTQQFQEKLSPKQERTPGFAGGDSEGSALLPMDPHYDNEVAAALKAPGERRQAGGPT